MSRNGSGTYSLPAGNPVTTGTQITATWGNTTLSDIATELTGSVAADGQTTITGPIKFSAGSVSAPAMTFSAETSTGFYRSASNVVSLSIAGVQKYIFGASTITLAGSASISGTEFGYLTGVTSAIQTQLNAKQGLDATLTALAGTLTAANKIPYATATDTASELTFNPSTALANSTSTVPSQTVVKTAVDAMAIATQVTPGTNGNVLTSNGAGAWVSSAPTQTVAAWVNFDATRNASGGTDSANTNRYIRASYNVASVLKNATGDYTISFTSALSDANYAIALGMGAGIFQAKDATTPRSTTSFRTQLLNFAGSGVDDAYLSAVVTR